MPEWQLDDEREARIQNEIIVDAYGPEEQARGWWTYLDEHLAFPFRVRCAVERRTSPLRVGERVTVERVAPEEDCSREMFVLVRWKHRSLAVPLSQLDGTDVDEDTHEAIRDWLYWVGQGYQF